VEFEWDEDKNRENIRKDGLDFVDAHQIFDEPMLIEVDNRADYGEERIIGIGFLKNFIVIRCFHGNAGKYNSNNFITQSNKI